MTWGTGVLLGIGISIVLYVAVRYMERDYYKRKHEIIQKKKERLEDLNVGESGKRAENKGKEEAPKR